MAAINFQNALGIHPDALQLRATRSAVIANNLANSDTPGFKARDIDFKSVLSGQMDSNKSIAVERTQKGHLAGNQRIDSELLYRNPMQPSIDGNTVDSQIEQALFARNAMNYNASFEFLNGKFTGIKSAIRGE